MDILKPIEYFLSKEDKYVDNQKGIPDYFYDENIGEVRLSNDADPLSFLERKRFHKAYRIVQDTKVNLRNTIATELSDSELLMVIVFELDMSFYFRDDYYEKGGIPAFVREMQKCLYSAIEKAPVFKGEILYRFYVPEDKQEFKIGEMFTCSFSLTTTIDDWSQYRDKYIIRVLPSSQTKAHCLYKIHNHGEENQVNFLPNASFVITDIKKVSHHGETYKHIYMNEI